MSVSNLRPVRTISQTPNGTSHVLSAGRNGIIGEIHDSTFFRSDWHSTTHVCRKHKAIGLNKAAFLQYILPFATVIVVPDKNTGRKYTATIKDFREYAIEYDKGRRIELCLPLVYWSVIEPDGTKSTQLRLFSIKQLELLDTFPKGKRA